jgi:hypothetical protein
MTAPPATSSTISGDPGRRLAREEQGRLAREHDEEICAGLNASEREQLMALLTRLAAQLGLSPGVHPGYRRL